ncbi:MAG: hypothetical protein AVDCRST_MAG95-1721 [uncultured Adhaeribacter sp.]|uniref:Uncharacterized protein n=1 Tax=uncultured Adhaeribacter sp. TaxID=448109 RepID=A0A6J4IE71_9BACT|nr:MAG: hypothetical protein AVDCRST_MAG95-1721 [uncultured Adhaeribacter sp.]
MIVLIFRFGPTEKRGNRRLFSLFGCSKLYIGTAGPGNNQQPLKIYLYKHLVYNV